MQDVVSGGQWKKQDYGSDAPKADVDARKIGVQIVDVRLKRVELPTEVSDAGHIVAWRLSVSGLPMNCARKVQLKLKKFVPMRPPALVIVADAYRDAQKVKGEGDAKAASIYGQAFSQSADFYAFYRSLEAYRGSFKSKNDVLVVEPNSDFFKFMKSSGRSNDKGK